MEKKVRRKSDPLMVQYLWDAITTIRNHKQLPSFDRIRRYMNRTHSMETDKVERHLEECTSDNLIIVSRKVGQKGSKVGVEQEGFRLPTPPDEPDSHDWYCFKCHESGEVVCCSKCYRVFHTQCLEPQDFPFQHGDYFTCPICRKRNIQRAVGRNRIAREELNALLLISISRMKEKLPHNILERVVTTTSQKSNMFINDRGPNHPPTKVEQNGGINLSEPWRAQILLHHQMDLRTMEQKCQDGRYRSTSDFEIDALTMVHNIVIFHGKDSPLVDLSRQMVRDCQYDIAELEMCKDCFQHAAKKNERYWFCRPCNPPHELVYAKDENYPYWPAKVLKMENDIYTVRFFGSNHHKATLDKASIKPITVNINTLIVKRPSTAWNKAYEELKKHQEFLVSGYHEDPPPPPPPPPPQPTFQHAFQPPQPPPPPLFPQHYHPFHTPQQYHQYPQPPPHPLIHPHHQPHWEAAVQSSEHHHRLVQSGLVSPPLVHFNTTSSSTSSTKKDNEAEVAREKVILKKEHHAEVKITENASRSDELNRVVNAEKRVAESPSESDHTSPSSSSSSRNKCPKKEPPVPDDLVSSSSQEHRTHSLGVQTSPRLLKMYVEELGEHSPKKGKGIKDTALRELADKLRKEHEMDKQRAIQLTIKQREKEIERIKEELESKYKTQISETKRKQWCWTCEGEAIYHCCWNTAYCSIECQQEHWHKEHKKNCRRKR